MDRIINAGLFVAGLLMLIIGIICLKIAFTVPIKEEPQIYLGSVNLSNFKDNYHGSLILSASNKKGIEELLT